LTDTILHASLSAIRDLEDAGVFVPQVGVNFAQSDLEDPQLITRILWALDQFDLEPDRLSVEVLKMLWFKTRHRRCATQSILWPSSDVTLILMISAPRKIHLILSAN
jgi:sensor c-di-GMP phosphodiesterase-like protein